MLKGHIDAVSRTRISGWAHRTSDPTRRETVLYRTGTGEVLQAVANIYRPDLEEAGIGDGTYGFSISLPKEHWLGRKPGRVEVEVAGARHTLTFDPCEEPAPRRQGASRSVFGVIDRVENGTISGWMTAPQAGALPMLTVDGQPVMRLDHPLCRPDVNRALGVAGDFGFTGHVGALRPGARVELHAVIGGRTIRLAAHRATTPWLETSFLRQLERARAIAAQPGAVAIACWDGAHNPIGRAKVLHDVVAGRRPALLASYLFDEFGGRVWPPLRSTNTALLTLPWTGRHLYQEAIRAAGIAFDTVWICKPRFPSFDLAAHLAAPEARLMLDLDDNEEHFSRSEAAQSKPYGLPTLNLVRCLTRDVPARTAASVTLAEDFDAHLLRHTRAPRAASTAPRLARAGAQEAITLAGPIARPRSLVLDRLLRRSRPELSGVPLAASKPDNKAVVGFIGTVRQHKHLLEAAQAVQIFNWSTGMEAVLHVYGDVQPKSLAAELEARKVVVRQMVPMAELHERIEALDVVLTGFPGSGAGDEAVTHYQITSKIGDALCAGRPVLVPRGPSVADLEDVPGVFLFDEASFGEALHAALNHRGRIVLPEAFTPDGAFLSFAAAEAQAEASPRAAAVLSGLVPAVAAQDPPDLAPTLLLVWKQHDAGLYGRRVDQVARSYKRAHPGHRVVVLELLHDQTVEGYLKQEGNFASEHRLLIEQMRGKATGQADGDGVVIHQVRFKSSEALPGLLERFLLEQRMLPANTVIALFPVIQFFDIVADLVADYPKVMDVVDNQFSWARQTDRQTILMRQYYTMARACDRIVFNSAENRDYFAALGLLPGGAAHKVVPNWYELPAGHAVSLDRKGAGPEVNVVYSGNMNDRIDWVLIARVAGLSEAMRVHLVGTANAANRDFVAVLEHPNVIYHGPRCERETLRLLETMDLAVMPHRVNAISTYMNPLKLQMYAAAGLPMVSTDVPGIEPHELLTVAGSAEAFVEAVRGLAAVRQPLRPSGGPSSGVAEYVAEINALRVAR